MRIRRDRRRPYTTLTAVRIGLFFLGSGIWVGGVVAGRRSVTGAALAVLVVAALLGFVERSRSDE